MQTGRQDACMMLFGARNIQNHCPILTYGAATRPDIATSRKKMQVSEMNTLRRVLGKTGRDRITSVNITDACKSQKHRGLVITLERPCQQNLWRESFTRQEGNRSSVNQECDGRIAQNNYWLQTGGISYAKKRRRK